jgi:aminoglycoside 6'-N-acetyltransferase I
LSGSKTATGESNPAVRRLTDADRAAWLSMRQALWMGSDTTTRAAEDGSLLSDPKRFGALAYAVFIALVRYKAVGFIEVSLRHDIETVAPHQAGYVEGIYVEPAHKSGGLGRALIGAAEAWTRDQGVGRLAAEAYADNGESLAFHEQLGFRRVGERTVKGRREIVMVKPVAP